MRLASSLAFTFILPFVLMMPLLADEPSLVIRNDEGDVILSGRGEAEYSHRVEWSLDLKEWTLVHALRDETTWEWFAEDWAMNPVGYYRMREVMPPAIAEHASWKTRVQLPDDPFLSDPIGGTGGIYESTEVRWVKFAIILDGLPTVYFQDSNAYTFHFPFAVERLGPFLGLSAEEFNAISLYRDGQQVILGAVVWAPGRNEYGIQFVGQDVYPRELIRFLYESVDAQIEKPEGAHGFYMPTYEQSNLAEGERDYFASHQIEVSSSDRWVSSNVAYTKGWALGRLVFVEGSEIESAYRSGQLLPTDILITDGVPAELPFLAGIITLTPTTPNSHVAILAQSYGIPFVYLKEESEREEVLSWVDRTVALRSNEWPYTVSVFEAADLDETYKSEILALKEPVDLHITPMEVSGSIVVDDLTDIVPEDIGKVGGKAANFGFLRRTIPDTSPSEAMAFTFDLWNEYLDQVLPGEGDQTLREAIAARLEGVEWPTDIAQLDVKLSEIRDLIEDAADFNAEQRTAILESLEPFDPLRKIRFRSSTNVEDSGVFVGAGLYDSYSGCLADDLDDDDEGPCLCDDEESNERGVFRAIRRVYASFYNLNAVIERLRHRIDESQVGMAVLVHYSFPDEFEAANGVATIEFDGNLLNSSMVTQKGAHSVTNPDGGSLPEIVDLETYSFDPEVAYLHHAQRSSLLLLGDETVLEWEADYSAFQQMFYALSEAFLEHYPNKEWVSLEFEYKKITDGSLVVKQIREVPEATVRLADAAALIGSGSRLKVFQGEVGTVFGNHRLKSLWQLDTVNRWLNEEGLESSLIRSSEIEYIGEDGISQFSGPLSELPGAVYDAPEIDGNRYARDQWTLSSELGDNDYELRLEVPKAFEYETRPLTRLEDLRIQYWAHYPVPMPAIDYMGEEDEVAEEMVVLVAGHPDDPLPVGSIFQERSVTSGSGVEVKTEFYWPPSPKGITAGYTAPMEKWVRTTITGLTDGPIVLEDYYSQTYRPGHHNFSEEFIFEPALEPDLNPQILAELDELDVRLIYLLVGEVQEERIRIMGRDGEFRDP